MSLSYSKKSVIGGPFDNGVITQLQKRKDVISKRNTRGPEDIKYLTSTTGWVRVISSVDIIGEGSTPAKNSILIGGTLNSFGGFNPGQANSTYKRSNEFGYVPTAGITSFQVRSKGTFGTLRDASFNFTVNSPEDFSKLEQLYLRPGFSILLEWGHTYYLSNNDGLLNPMTDLFDIDSFLRKKSSKSIESTIASKKGEKGGGNSYNYDGMFGIIKNFIWNYNGYTYECQVDVVSTGDVVESVQAAMSPLVQIREDNENNDIKYTPYGSELEAYLKLIADAPGTAPGPVETDNIVYSWLKPQNSRITDSILQQHKDLNKRFEILTSARTLTANEETGVTRYITLRTLFMLLNEISMVCSDNVPTPRFNVGEDNIKNTYTTFPEHIGLNLGICVLPKKSANLRKYYFIVNNTPSEDLDDILQIYVSVNFLLSILESKRDSVDTETKVVDFVLYDVLKAIQINLGDINYFDLHDEIKGGVTYLHIVDRTVIPDKNNVKTKLDLVGLGTEVSNLNITSKLSSNLTSMIAISAQDVYSPSSGQDLFNIQKWNVGLRDRHLTNLKVGKASTTSSEIEPDEVISQELKEKLEDYIAQLNGLLNTDTGNILPDPSGHSSIHKQIMKEYVRSYTTQKRTNPPGLIPFELTFTLKGISGIKVGQAFTVNDFFLPQRYRGKVGFIVTGVDHQVSDNRWVTDIKSQMIFL